MRLTPSSLLLPILLHSSPSSVRSFLPAAPRPTRTSAARTCSHASRRAKMSEFDADPATMPLTHLCQVSLEACEALKPMICGFYGAINAPSSSSSKEKADASIFTIADGLVQHMLVEHLFGPSSFCGIVGEEECAVNINPATTASGGKYTVDDLVVPDEFRSLIDETAAKMRLLSSKLQQQETLKQISIFIDPIDGTREFSTGLGEQSSICIGFADAATGKPIAGLVYRPIPAVATWAMGAASEQFASSRFGADSSGDSNGLLTSNGGISSFVSSLLRGQEEGSEGIGGGIPRVPSGGAGNKMLMLLEGRGAAYIQDRGVSRWDTCGAQAVIEAHGGILCKLSSFLTTQKAVIDSYTYRASPVNLDFEPGQANLTPYNSNVTIVKGAPPQLATSPEQVKPYANLCGLVALSSAGTKDLDVWHKRIVAAAAENAPSYD